MSTRSRFSLSVALLFVVLAPLARAADNEVRTITNVVDNAGTNYTFGVGYNNTLFITNGAQLTNVAVGLIGPTWPYAGTNNGLLVSGAGSMWQSTSYLQIGNQANDSFNWMIISNGGAAISSGAYAIGGTASASNRVVVTGSGSVWTNIAGVMRIGNNGSGNSLTISDSGRVVSAGASLGVNNSSSLGNWVLVTGTGSVWDASAGAIVVGAQAASQRLIISNGGTVLSQSGRTGGDLSSYNSAENFVLVTGAGSLWSNITTLTIGNGKTSRDLMEIRNGGRVTSTAGTIGSGYNSASNSSVLVTDPGSLWFMGSSLLSLGGGWGHSLVISNEGTVRAGNAIVGYGAGSSNSTILVTGTGSMLTNTGILTVGYTGGSNLLRIVSGGTVVSGSGRLGFNSGDSRDNLVIVEGANSLWNAGSSLVLGSTSAGPSNRVSVTAGGALLSGSATIGEVASTFGNSVTVSGTDSVWRVAGTVTVGASVSSNNFMLVVNGGLVESSGLVAAANIGNSISNAGGIFQFTTRTPTITAGSAGAIVLDNGTLGFRGITNGSPVLGGTQLTNITFVGNNAFRLDTATNAAGLGSYTFDSVANTGMASNFQRLAFAGSGSLWRSANLQIGAGGAVVGNGTIQANMVTNQGTLAPGNSPGLLTFTSNLTLLSSSVLNMELAGTNTALFDRITVGGAFAVDGTLNVSLIDGFTPQAGDTFKLFGFDVSLISGTFATTSFGALSGGLVWDTSDLYITGTLGVIPIPEPRALALLSVAALLALCRRRETS
ncbi:MAG: hypothetical protein IT578_01190 [Verrucomicrobiae bacterium]|nr:hypothetical protein [Verrucomicrobiae bacterium]